MLPGEVDDTELLAEHCKHSVDGVDPSGGLSALELADESDAQPGKLSKLSLREAVHAAPIQDETGDRIIPIGTFLASRSHLAEKRRALSNGWP